MTYNKARRIAQKPITTGSRLRTALERIQDNTDRLTGGGLPTDELLRLMRHERDLVNQALDLGILLSREKGTSWARIGEALGLTPQAIEQRMRRLSTRVDIAEKAA